MHARSTTITGDPGALDLTIDYVRDDVMPAIRALDGCLGLSVVVDRSLGRMIATSSWRDAAALRASDAELVWRRLHAGKILGGSPRAEEWEVAGMHRDHEAHDDRRCRITWGRTDDLPSWIEGWTGERLASLERLPGFCSASLLVNREHGLTCETVTFDSPATSAAAGDAVARQLPGTETLHAGEFDLVIAQLRVPELA